MKRILAILVGLFTLVSVSKADNRPVRFEQLPKEAQKFVKTNFPDSKIVYSVKDDDVISPEYEVALDNATAFLDSPSQQLTLSSDKEYGR